MRGRRTADARRRLPRHPRDPHRRRRHAHGDRDDLVPAVPRGHRRGAAELADGRARGPGDRRAQLRARHGPGGPAQQGESLDTPICGTADCQVYGGIPHPRPPGMARWYRAVRETRGQVLLFGGRPADTVYFSTSNGRTYGNDEVFGSSPLPYLRPVAERDDGASPLSRWQVELPVDDLTTVLRAAGEWPDGTAIASAAVEARRCALEERRTHRHDRRRHPARRREHVGALPAAPPLPERRAPGHDPLGLVRRLRRSTGPRRLGPRVGPRRGHGAVGRVREGPSRAGRPRRSSPSTTAASRRSVSRNRARCRSSIATGLRSMIVKPTEAGAVIGGRALGRRPLRIEGGEAVTVSSSSG